MVSEGRGVSPPMIIVCRAFEVAVHPRCWLPYVTEVVAGAQCVFRVTPFVVPRGQLVKVRVAVRTVAFVPMRRRRLCRWDGSVCAGAGYYAMMALKVTNWDAEAVDRSGEGIAKCRKVRSQCYFNVIFSFSRSQMPHNKPSYSDLLDFFAYICAPILGGN